MNQKFKNWEVEKKLFIEEKQKINSEINMEIKSIQGRKKYDSIHSDRYRK